MAEQSRRSADCGTAEMDDRLVINLRNLGHTIRFLYEGKGSRKRILIILYKAGCMTQKELTERIGVQPGSASEVLGKMELAGLVERSPSSKDRRTAELKLTALGRSEAAEALRQRTERHREMFSCLTPEEQYKLLELTEKLQRDWNSRYCSGRN